jgi:6-phosphogluconolactonase
MAESRNIIVESSPAAAAARGVQLFKTIVSQAIARHGVCHVALAGGTTPHTMYRLLARQATVDDVPWSKVEVFVGDERDVPLDDVESNFRMIQRTLLDNAPVDWSRVHAMRADADDIDASAAEYEATIRHLLPPDAQGVPQFDLVMLGMGGDGHTASLFPDSEVLRETQKLVASVFVPVLGRKRMTMTFPLLNAARHVLMLVTGDDKAHVVQRIFGPDGPDTTLPAGRLQPKGTLYLVLDTAAARLL